MRDADVDAGAHGTGTRKDQQKERRVSRHVIPVLIEQEGKKASLFLASK